VEDRESGFFNGRKEFSYRKEETVTKAKTDPILFEVLRHRIDEIVAEAYYTLARTSGNAVIAECGDHQEALLDADGNTVLAAGGVVHWTYVLEEAGRHIVKAYEDNPGIYDGDHFVFNDSYIASIHHMDIMVLSPVFWEGRRVAWMVTAGHTMDIGGIDPGGTMIRAEEIAQEGLRLPGIKLFERGRIRKDIADTLKAMTRQPDILMLDIAARIAANNASAKRLKETIEKYAINTVLAVFQEIQEYSETLARAKLRKIPDGTWRVVNYLESIRKEEPYLRMELTVSNKDGELTFDFTGSSPQSRGSQNVAAVGAKASAICSYLQVLAYDIPWSSGVWQPIKWIMPEGTVANPRFPAAVSMSCPSGLVNQIIAGSLIVMSSMALASKDLKEDVYAGIGAALESAVWYGMDKAGQFFVTYNMETIISGSGALPSKDGEEACLYEYTSKPSVANIEALEELFPVMYLFRKEAIDTGGPGKFRGGVGNAIAIIPWDTGSIWINSIGVGQEPRVTYGLAGGYPSNNGLQMVIRNSDILEMFKKGRFPLGIEEIRGHQEIIPSFHMYSISPADVHVQYQAGGGGFGDPIDRDPNLVARDVRLGYVSLEAAKEIYGVVIETEALEVNEEKTRQQRQIIIKNRLSMGRKST
jgi:N-methylhydantoinase B